MNSDDKDMLNESKAYHAHLEKLQQKNQENIEARELWKKAKGPKPPEKEMQQARPILSEKEMHEQARDRSRAGRIADQKNRKLEGHSSPESKEVAKESPVKARLRKQREQSRGRTRRR